MTIVEHRQFQQLITEYYRNTVTIKRKILLQEDTKNCIQKEEFAAVLQIMLHHPRVRRVSITVSLYQRAQNEGFLSFSPRICVGIIHPVDAIIFKHLRDGDMDAFLALLQNGEATVWDHDTSGNPLLYV